MIHNHAVRADFFAPPGPIILPSHFSNDPFSMLFAKYLNHPGAAIETLVNSNPLLSGPIMHKHSIWPT